MQQAGTAQSTRSFVAVSVDPAILTDKSKHLSTVRCTTNRYSVFFFALFGSRRQVKGDTYWLYRQAEYEIKGYALGHDACSEIEPVTYSQINIV